MSERTRTIIVLIIAALYAAVAAYVKIGMSVHEMPLHEMHVIAT